MDPQHRAAPRWTGVLVALLCVLTGCATSDGEGPSTAPSAGSREESPPRGPSTYVALGDSFVSAPLVPVTDVANGCFRSSANYPSLVAEELDAELDDRSCGGARTADFETSQFPGVPPQLDALRPGVDLVTIGIGGNDGGVFSLLTQRCPALRSRDPQGAPCRDFMAGDGQDTLLGALARTRTKVTDLVASVRRRAPDAQVLVVGYPQIVSADNPCDELPLARGDFAYAEEVNRTLTDALRHAARATGSTYVDVWTASRGHDICSDDPWVNGSVTDQRRAAAYHPFAEEQAAVADLVVAAVER